MHVYIRECVNYMEIGIKGSKGGSEYGNIGKNFR